MPAVGTKRASQFIRSMSAIGGKADMPIALRNVRLRPKADMAPYQCVSLSRYEALSEPRERL